MKKVAEETENEKKIWNTKKIQKQEEKMMMMTITAMFYEWFVQESW